MNQRSESEVRLPRGAIIVVLALAALIPFVLTLRFGFVLDDGAIIQTNPDLAGGWRSLFEVWTQPYGGRVVRNPGLYRPLLMWFFAALWNVGGHSAFWFHLVVVAMHVAATVLVWRLLTRCLDEWPAILAAVWFAVHPLHTEVIANITNSAEVIVGLWMCTLALYIAAIEDSGARVTWKRAVIAGVLFLGAFLTKESGAVAPILAAVYVWGWRRPGGAPSRVTVWSFMSRWWPVMLAWVTAAAIVFLLRTVVLGNPITRVSIAAPGLAELSAPQRMWAMLSLGPAILRLLIWPATHNPYYGPSTFVEPRTLWAAITILVLVLALVLAVRRARQGGRRPLAAVAWILLAFVPASNLFVATGQILAERTLYVSSIGMAMLIGMAIEAATARAAAFPNPRLLRGAGMAVIAIVIAATAVRTTLFANLWQNHSLLFAQMIRADSSSYKGYWMSGLDARYQGRPDDAVVLFGKAYELYPTDRSVIMDYSMALSAQGNDTRAASVAAKLMDQARNRSDPRALAFYLAALARAFGPESVMAAARRLAPDKRGLVLAPP